MCAVDAAEVGVTFVEVLATATMILTPGTQLGASGTDYGEEEILVDPKNSEYVYRV